jgi:Zn-dependent protease
MDPFTIFFLIALIFSIIIHEVSHGYMASALGDPTARLQGRLTLNPIPHIDPIGSILLPALLVLTNAPFLFGWAKPVPYNPYNLKNQRWGEALVAGAGPGVNLVLAIAFGLVVRFGVGTLSPTFLSFAGLIVYINILLAFFNLLPIPPLDGSKLLKSMLPFRASRSFEQFENALMQGGFLFMFLVLWLIMQLIGPLFHSGLSFVFGLITGVDMNSLL